MRPLPVRTLLAALALGCGAVSAAEPAGPDLHVKLGQSYIYETQGPVARVLVSDQQVAGVQLLDEGQVQVLGSALGTTDLWVWFRADPAHPERHVLTVERDLRALDQRLAELCGDGLRSSTLDDRLVVEGEVPDGATLAAATALARVTDPEFINLIRVVGQDQVQLRVLFAEVNRSRLREMGLDALWSDGGLLAGAELSGSSAASSVYDAFQLVGALSSPLDLSLTLSVLEEHNLGRTLARPTLVAMSGQKAEFLVGGEIPIPVGQGDNQITLEYKEYGVKVAFVPTVLADGEIQVEASVEVSDTDASSGVTLQGLSVPALSTRKSNATLRMHSGMTFAMAGMLSESVQSTTVQVPLLGDIPVLGALFRHVSHDHDERELMIFVTPELVSPLAPGEVPEPPGLPTLEDPTDFELFLLGRDHHGSRPAPVPGVGLERP